MKDSQRIATIRNFLKYAYKELGIKSAPKISLVQDKSVAQQHRTFGGYMPQTKELWVYIGSRNLADILRTLAHELTHHHQHESAGIASDDGETGSDIENEANAKAGVIMRNYAKMNPVIFESVDMRELKEDLQKYQIYCDMDGVLCDFDSQFDHFFGTDPKSFIKERGMVSFNKVIDDIGVEFWSKMPWMPEGQQLWLKIGKHGAIILSSPGDFKHARAGKLEWIKSNLSPSPIQVIFEDTGNKHVVLQGKSEVEKEHSVLIDDYVKNLVPWSKEGGKIVKHNSGKESSHVLDQL